MAQQTYTTEENLLPDWAAEPITAHKLIPGGARLVPSAFPIVPSEVLTVGTAGAAFGATTIPLTAAVGQIIPLGTTLDFGGVAAATITVTATPADAATTLAVAALPRYIPAGTYLNFGTGKFAVVTTAAAAGATSLTTLAMPAGTKPVDTDTATLPAERKTATLTADAAAGATSLTVVALTYPLASGESAFFSQGTERPVKAGTLVGRTFAERTAGTGFGAADIDNDDEIYLTAFTVRDAAIRPDVALLRHRTLIFENRLPGWANYSEDEQAKIRELYDCIEGA